MYRENGEVLVLSFVEGLAVVKAANFELGISS
jgi:hypothetical protein